MLHLKDSKIFTTHNDTENYLQILTQAAITCSKLTIETVEQGVKYIQS